jgi:hypothetical protein
MENNPLLPDCRHCPGKYFEMGFIPPSSYMGVCNARHCTLTAKFPMNNTNDRRINKANLNDVVFDPLANCPFIERLRNEGIIPWPDSIIDFSKK